MGRNAEYLGKRRLISGEAGGPTFGRPVASILEVCGWFFRRSGSGVLIVFVALSQPAVSYLEGSLRQMRVAGFEA